ncbi:MAG: 16S rRNA processing protein RimM [Bacteroidetes bacterium]|nr:MAG: 16S rRNA processing protein RimM [Bacteroidota bacterium]
MDKSDFYYLGKITKLFGYKGELVFFFDVDDITEYRGLDAVFIDVNGDLIPFMIEKLRLHQGNTAIVRIQDVHDIDEAQRLVNSELYLPLSTLPKLDGNKFYYHEIIGYTVIDADAGEVGIVEEVNDQTAQALLIIKDGYKEILFPIVDELIDKLDREKKIIYVHFPEGLLDLYQ